MKKIKKKINVLEPNLSSLEKNSLLKTFSKGEISTYGETTNILNSKIKKLCGAKYCFSTTSGSTGLFLSFKSIGVTENDLIITQSYTFVATISSINAAGGHPWLFDVKKSNLTIDLDQVEKTLKNNTFKIKNHFYHKKTKKRIFAIAPVYTNGFMCDYKRIYKIAKKYNLFVVSDLAGSFLTLTENKKINNFSHLSVVSFNGNKSITGGGGGCMLTNNKKFYEKLSSLATNCTLIKKYHYKSLGYNFKITNLHSSIVLAQLSRLQEIKKKVKNNENFYRKYLKQENMKYFSTSKSGEMVWLNLLYFNNKKKKDLIIKKLFNHKINTHSFWKPIHLQNLGVKFMKENLKVTNDIADKVLALPSSSFLKKNEIANICRIINN